MIAFVGVDGAGKTTIVKALQGGKEIVINSTKFLEFR